MAIEHDLTAAPIPRLIRQISLPVMVGFFFNTMFNVVDTYFGGKISTDALAAMSFSFPVFFLIIIFDAGTSTGITAIIANILGSKKAEVVHKYAAQSVSFALMVALVLTIMGLSLAPFLFRVLGAGGTALALALQYINILLLGSVFFMIVSVMNALLQAAGDTRTYRNFLIVGFLLNVVLDPWFLYGGFGMPAFGFRGVALSTVLIEFCGALYLSRRVIRTDFIAHAVIRDFRPSLRIFREIAQQSVPASLNMATIGVGIFIITSFIGRFGENAVAAYGIATRVEQIVLLPTIGLTIACLAIVGQNNGAGKPDRIRETYRLCLRFGIVVMAVGGALIFVFARTLMGFFTSDTNVLGIGSHYLRIAAFISIAYPILFVTISFLQGMKRPLYALFIGAYRQIFAPLIVFPFLIPVFGTSIDGVWWGIFGITWSAAIITLGYARYVFVGVMVRETQTLS